MEPWHVTDLSPALRIDIVADTTEIPGAVADEIETIWAQARAADPRLFNGRVFSAREITPTRIVGYWTEYKRALAQIRRPALFDTLRIRSLAVNGVVHGPDGVAFGRRDTRAIYQPGLWQCPPAGSVESRAGADAVDLAAQVLAELAEELGMPHASVSGLAPLAAVEHPGSHVVDVGMALATDWSADAIHRAWTESGSAEYEALVVVPEAYLAARLAEWGEEVVPPARIFLALLFPGLGL